MAMKLRKYDNSYYAPGGSYTNYNCSGAPTGGSDYGSIYKTIDTGTIFWETGPQRFRYKVPYVRDCTHRTTDVRNEYLNFACGPNAAQYFQYNNALHGLFALSEAQLVLPTEPAHLEVRNFLAEAFESMQPSLEGSISLTNALLEFRDLPRLLTSIGKWSKLARRLRYRYKRRRKVTLQDAKEYVKTFSDSHLAYTFGLKPMIQDVKETILSLMEYRQRIDEFIKQSEEVQSKHYKKVLDDAKSTTTRYSQSFMNIKQYSTVKATLHCGMHYKYRILTDLRSDLAKLNAIRDMVGLHLNYEVIWDSIPFTFILDWIVPVGAFLRQFNQNVVKVKLDVIQCYYSYKATHVAYVRVDYSKACNEYGTRVQKQTALGSNSLYIRKKCTPESGTYFTSGARFGPTQLALSASLLITRIK
jgi:hypothetical protein